MSMERVSNSNGSCSPNAPILHPQKKLKIGIPTFLEQKQKEKCVLPLEQKSLSLGVLPKSKQIRLTPDEKGMIKIREEAAKAHQVDSSKLPINEPLREGVPITLSGTVCSFTGTKHKDNEDRCIGFRTKLGDFFALCDGHCGPNEIKINNKTPGEFISEMIIKSIQTKLPELVSKYYPHTKIAFEKWCEQIQSQIPAVSGGATVAIAFYETVTKFLHVATVGDTEVVVFREFKEGKIYPIPMSPKMGWDHPDAIQRIQKILPPEEFEKWKSIELLKLKRFPPVGGINCAYTLGDKLMTIDDKTAISHTPECSLLQLQNGDLVLLASDGLWDVATPDEVIDDAIEPHWKKDSVDFSHLIASYAINTKESKDDVTVLAVQAGPRVMGVIKDEIPLISKQTEDDDEVPATPPVKPTDEDETDEDEIISDSPS